MHRDFRSSIQGRNLCNLCFRCCLQIDQLHIVSKYQILARWQRSPSRKLNKSHCLLKILCLRHMLYTSSVTSMVPHHQAHNKGKPTCLTYRCSFLMHNLSIAKSLRVKSSQLRKMRTLSFLLDLRMCHLRTMDKLRFLSYRQRRLFHKQCTGTGPTPIGVSPIRISCILSYLEHLRIDPVNTRGIRQYQFRLRMCRHGTWNTS